MLYFILEGEEGGNMKDYYTHQWDFELKELERILFCYYGRDWFEPVGKNHRL